MWARFANWLLRPSIGEDADKTATARLLNTFLLMSLGAVIAYIAGSGVLGGLPSTGVLVALGAYSGAVLVALRLLRGGHTQIVGIVTTLSMWGLCTALVLLFGGIHDEIIPGYFVVIAAAGLILGGRGLLAFAVLSGGALAVGFYLEMAGVLFPETVQPSELRDLVVILVLMALLAFFVHNASQRIRMEAAAARKHAQAVRDAHADLAASYTTLATEQARLTRRLQASIAVTQVATASVGDLEQLLFRVSEALAREFGFYHVAIFWVNPAEGVVALRAASGAEGKRMPAYGHRSRIGEGIVGSVALDGRPRLVSDVTVDPDFVYDVDLPGTRSELAVPILSQDEVLAVVDIQCLEDRALTEEDSEVVQSLARQLSLAIANARHLENVQRELETAERAYRDITQEDWRRLLQSERGLGFLSTRQGTALVDASQMDVAVAQTTGVARSEGQAVRLPVELAGQTVAEIEAHLPPGQADWTLEQMALLETFSAQLSQALERARLYRETQRRATRERVLREISDEMGRASDLPSLLRLTVESLNRSLGGAHLYVKLAAQAGTLEEAELA